MIRSINSLEVISTNIIVLHSLYSPIQVPFFSTEVENKKK